MAKIERTDDKIYQLKVTLVGSKPPIWRRLAVPGDFTFEELHGAIQVSFEWENAHMHQFILGNRDNAVIISHPSFELVGTDVKDVKVVEKMLSGLGFDEELVSLDDLADSNVLNESLVLLEEVVSQVGAKLVYEYDFGDRWEHEIVVEKISVLEPDIEYPVCLDGARSGPPEDCGGIGGYADLLEVLGDPNRDDHEDALEWIGDDFDPEDFDIEAVNAEMSYYEDYLVLPDDSLFDDEEGILSDEQIEEAVQMINEQTKAFIQEVIPSTDGFALRFPGGIPLVNVVIPQFVTMTYAQYPQLKAIFEIGPGSEPVWARFTGSQEDVQAVKDLMGIK